MFKPGVPHLYTPNLSAWLVLELCPGRTDLELEQAFVDAASPAIEESEARRQVQEGVELLLEQGLIERASGLDAQQARA